MALTDTTGSNVNVWEKYGKSTDPKPVSGVENGCRIYEMDTGKVFMFDVDTHTWIEQ